MQTKLVFPLVVVLPDAATSGTITEAYTYGNTDWVDLLTEFNGTAISYDASGNPLN